MDQFVNNGMNQDLTKYNTVVAELNKNILVSVVSILSYPPR